MPWWIVIFAVLKIIGALNCDHCLTFKVKLILCGMYVNLNQFPQNEIFSLVWLKFYRYKYFYNSVQWICIDLFNPNLYCIRVPYYMLPLFFRHFDQSSCLCSEKTAAITKNCFQFPVLKMFLRCSRRKWKLRTIERLMKVYHALVNFLHRSICLPLPSFIMV